MKITGKPQLMPVTSSEDKRSNWETLINGIIRPPRANYRSAQLGQKTFTLNQSMYHRSDEIVMYQQKYKIQLTIFSPQYRNNAILLYLHGNSSSKLQSLTILRHLPLRFSLAAFDFIGCGLNNQLDTVTLGSRQSKQVQTVVEYLKTKGYDVILWGRSMGAASALRYGKASIIVSDSTFKSLRSLCKQIAKNNSPNYVPNCLISCFFPCVFYKLKKDVQQRGQYDMDSIDIKQAIKKIDINTTLIFLSGNQDVLINHSNSQKLYNSFPGKRKYIQIFKGNHNSKRPQQVLKKIMGIIVKQYQDKKLQTSSASTSKGQNDFVL